MPSNVTLELGDVIVIKNRESIDTTYVITYIDSEIIIIHNIRDLSIREVNIVNSHIEDETIIELSVIYRNPLNGYALQHGLYVGLGVNIQLSAGPPNLVGEILGLTDDMITVLLDNTFELLYIDFKYQGLPLDNNKQPIITHITPFKYPTQDRPKDRIISLITNDILPNIQFKDGGINIPNIVRVIIQKYPRVLTTNMAPYIKSLVVEYFNRLNASRSVTTNPSLKPLQDAPNEVDRIQQDAPVYKLQLAITDADKLLEDELYITTDEDLETSITYDIEEQSKEMLNELLSTIPDNSRTSQVMRNIHTIINRFSQLYILYILNNTYPNIIDNISNHEGKSFWAIPVVTQQPPQSTTSIESQLAELVTGYNTSGDNRYAEYLRNIDRIFSSMYAYNSSDCAYIHSLPMDNSVISLSETNIPEITKYTANDTICQTGVLILPLFMQYYSSYLNDTTLLYTKSNAPMIVLNSILKRIPLTNIHPYSTIPTDIDNNTASTNYLLPVDNTSDGIQKSKEYLRSIITNECNITKYLRSYGSGYTIEGLISNLSIYKMYYFNIHVKEYIQLQQVLRSRLEKYHTKYNNAQRLLNTLHKKIKSVSVSKAQNPLCSLIHKDINRDILDSYLYSDGCNTTSSEFITYIKNIDGGVFYIMCIMLSYILKYPEYKYTPLKQTEVDTISLSDLPVDVIYNDSNSGTPVCSNVNVVHKYVSIEDLMEDNHKEISYKDTIVSENDYAMLYETPNTVSYYIRKNNTWVKDPKVLPTFILDSPRMYCNLKLRCTPDIKSNKCIPLADMTVNIMNMLNADIASNLNSITPFDVKSSSDMLERYYTKLQNLIYIHQHTKIKNDARRYILGTTVEKVDIESSPYTEELIYILGEVVPHTRYQALLTFCNSYTRPNNIDNGAENGHWRYCVITGVPLVPTSLYDIAYLYSIHSNDLEAFNTQFELLKKRVGVLGDDGNSIVDKFTGFKISNIAFDLSEDYDESGFLIKTREVLEADEDDIKNQILNNLQVERETLIIKHSVKILTEKMGIDLSTMLPFIIQKINLYLPTNKDHGLSRSTLILLYVISMIIICIQIRIPAPKPTHEVPGCEIKLTGYPMSGDKSDSAMIQYVLCVVKALNIPKEPWSIITEYTPASMIIQIIHIMDSYFIPDIDISSKIEYKKRYLTYHIPDTTIERSIEQWDNFSPIKNVELLTYGRTSKEFTLADIDTIISTPTTHTINDINTAIYNISLRIQSYIYNIISRNSKVDKKGYIYTSKKRIANSCCNTNIDVSIFEYLVSEEAQIWPYSERAKKMAEIANIYRLLFKGSTISCRISPRVNEKIYTNRYQVFQSTIDLLFRKRREVTNTVEISETPGSGEKYNTAEFNELLKSLYGSHLGKILPISELLNKEVFNASFMVHYLTSVYSEPKRVTSPAFIISKLFIDQIINIGNMYISPLNNKESTKSVLSQFRTFLQSGISQMYGIISSIITEPKQISVVNKLNPKKVSYIFDNFSSPRMAISEGVQWLTQMAGVVPNMIIHSKNNPGVIKLNLSQQHVTDIYTILNAKYEYISSLHTPLLRSVFSEITPSLNTFLDVVRITMLFCKKYLNIETTIILIKYYVHSLLVFLLVPQNITNMEYSPKQIQTDIIKYIVTSFDMCTNSIIQIDKKIITMADDNIQIKNIEKNNLLKEMENLTKDEQVSNKMLKQLKLKRWATPANLRVFNKKGYDKDAKIQYGETDAPIDFDTGDIMVDDTIIDDIDDSANIYTDPGDNDNFGYDMDLDTDIGDNVNWEIDRDYMDSNEGEGYNDEY